MPATLSLLRIRNLALVEDLEWHLAPGFTAITGETGAGKSIIIGALQLLLGDRTDKTLIRTGTESCLVEAIFEGADLEVQLTSILDESGVESGESELIVKRSFSTTGTNRQFINGSPTTLAVLKNLGDELIDLHGPHDHQSLLSPERQLALLDGYAHTAGEILARLRARLPQTAGRSVPNKWRWARPNPSANRRSISFAIRLPRSRTPNLTAGEEEEIAARYRLAANSKRLVELAGSISRRLSEADDSILPQLAETQRLLRELEKIDPDQATLAEAHAACVVELSGDFALRDPRATTPSNSISIRDSWPRWKSGLIFSKP